MGQSIQFHDKESVIEAFQNRNVSAFSIWCGKQFLTKGIGEDAFTQFVDILEKGDSSALYTVKVYEDITDEKMIKSKTEDDGSFNFRLNEDIRDQYRLLRNGEGGYSSRAQESKENAILTRLGAIEAKLTETDTGGEDDGLGIVGKLLNHPVIGSVAPKIIEVLLAAITGKPKEQFQPGPQQYLPAQYAAINGIDEDRIISEAVTELKKYDPDLAKHLQKLVAIAQTNFSTFQVIVKSLD